MFLSSPLPLTNISLFETQRNRENHRERKRVQCSVFSHGYHKFRDLLTHHQSPSYSWSLISKMWLLWIHRGVHPCIHSSCPRAVPRPLDMRAMCWGSEGWSDKVRHGYLYWRSTQSPHNFLQEIQILTFFERSRAPNLCYGQGSPAKLGLSESSSV